MSESYGAEHHPFIESRDFFVLPGNARRNGWGSPHPLHSHSIAMKFFSQLNPLDSVNFD